MVVEGSGIRGQGSGTSGQALVVRSRLSTVAACAVAIVAVLPLVAPEVWSGFRLATADSVLSAMSSFEQPLSVRSPGGPWAVGLALAWFAMAYWRRNFSLWEAALVLIGGAAALARVGNLWLDAAALVLPLARQLVLLKLIPAVGAGVVAGCLVVTGLTFVQTRPPELPPAAVEAARQATAQGKVLADWRWAGELQEQLGSGRDVLASGGPPSEPTDFWLDYLRIAQGHEHWGDLLRRMDIDTVVLESDGQQHPAAELVRASPEWRVTYDVGDALVAERASP
jgi:hypothetical protein